MIRTFILRNLLRHPALNLIRVLGLSLALGSSLIILLYLKYELSYEKFNSNSERIYRVTTCNPAFLGGKHFARIYRSSDIPKLAAYFPGIDDYVRMAPVWGGVIKYKTDFYTLKEGFEVDSSFFRIFDARIISGNPQEVLVGNGSLVISEGFAKKIFGESDPVGQILTIPAGQFYGKDEDFVITGIMADFPGNSHFHPDFVATPVDRSILDGWSWSYLLLNENADPQQIIDGYKGFYAAQVNPDSPDTEETLYLQALNDIHLKSRKTREIEPNSSMAVIFSFFLAVILLLSIALINYINLSIGMAGYSERYLFVGRVFGASRDKELTYLITEGSVLMFFALLLSFFFIWPALQFVKRRFMLELISDSAAYIALATFLFCVLVVLTGSLILWSQGRGKLTGFTDQYSGSVFRKRNISKPLIVAQNTFLVVLIIAVIVIQRQAAFAIRSGMGSENPDLVCFENVHTGIQDKFVLFKNDLASYNSIESVTAMMEPPGGEANDMFPFTMEGYIPDESRELDNYIGVFPVDYSFPEAFNLTFIAGRDFSENYEDNNGSGEYIINRSAMQRLGYFNPQEIVNKDFALSFFNDFIKLPEGKIIGVVEDFYLSSLKRATDPLVLFKRKDLWLINFIVAFRPGMEEQGMDDLKLVWNKFYPEYPFQPEYVDQLYRDLYSAEILQAKLLALFTIISLFICSMGLLGLSLLTTQKRIREIGIRKVNGASTLSVMLLFNRDFLKWIFLSVLLAVPLSWYALSKWMESYVYKTAISWWIFVLAGLMAVFVALLTVSAQSWKAANNNPVESLRHE